MPRVLQLLTAGRKSFVQPPFWANLANSAWVGGWTPDKERIENDFEAYVTEAYKSNGIVFACILARQWIFSEARFAYRKFNDSGRPGQLFSDPSLALLEKPWPNGTTGELLARMESDASLAGNFYGTTADDAGRLGKAATGPGRRVVRLRPDWVTIVLGSRTDNPYAVDARPVAYQYRPPSYQGTPADETILLPSEVCHYSPIPDPIARFRGMSWLTPVVREIEADNAATRHKLKFFEQGATLGPVVRLNKDVSPAEFDEFVQRFRAQHEGVDTAYKTLFIGGGADITLAAANMQQIEFRATQGAGETRIAAAARMHPIVVGLSEALQGSSLNAGNFAEARRITADAAMRPLWRMAAASLESLVAPPENSQLWYDDRDIAFLRNDAKDAAEAAQAQAITVRQYVDAGFEADSVVEAMQTGDITRLVHSGLFSVQLQPPGQRET